MIIATVTFTNGLTGGPPQVIRRFQILEALARERRCD